MSIFNSSENLGASSALFVAMDGGSSGTPSVSLVVDLGVSMADFVRSIQNVNQTDGALSAAGTVAVWDLDSDTRTVNGVPVAGSYAWSVTVADFFANAQGGVRWGVIGADNVSGAIGASNKLVNRNMLATGAPTLTSIGQVTSAAAISSGVGAFQNFVSAQSNLGVSGTHATADEGASTASTGPAFLNTTLRGNFNNQLPWSYLSDVDTSSNLFLVNQQSNPVVYQLGDVYGVDALLLDRVATFHYDSATHLLTFRSSTDILGPTASIVVADTLLTAGETSAVTISFSEAVTGLTAADFSVANGSLGGLATADGGIQWTATLTPTSGVTDSSNLITLDNSGVADLAGNGGSGTTDSNNYAIDTQNIDSVPPTASIVVADTALKIGETSSVTITFSEAVTGLTAADLAVANGSLSGLATADGGVTWTATLTPAASVTDSANLITLDNTGVADLAGNAGTGTTGSNSYAVDTARPTASIAVADTALMIGETSAVTISFSEAVTGLTTADVSVANGSLSGLATTDGGITWTATLTPAASITDSTNLVTLDNTGVADLAGNAGTGTTDSNSYAVDTARPTAGIVVADTALKVGETSAVTISFSEAVTGLSTADFSVANGSLSGLSTTDGGITWTATLTPEASVIDSTNRITLDATGVTDLAGNPGTGSTDSNNYAVDTVRPTANIVVADTALKIGETSAVTISFSEAVTGLSLADLSVANGSLGGLGTADGGITWTATLTPTASVTDASNVVTLDNSGVVNLAGNAGAGSTDSNNYGVDTVRPTAGIVVAPAAIGVGQTSVVTVTFSEAVTGLDIADFSVANGALTNLATADGGVTWTATLAPTASITDATNLVTLDITGVADLAGNAGTGSTDSNNYSVDTVTVRPTATILVADTVLAIGEASSVTITFSEAVTGLSIADFSVANGSLGGLGTADGGVTWVATLTPAGSVTDITNLVTLDNAGVANLAGTEGTGTTDSNNYAVDTARPTASIVVGDTALKIGETSTVTISFSEPVAGLSTANFSVANGSLGGLASSDGGITWTATLTPAASVSDTTNLIALANAGVADLAGNAGSGTTDSNNYAVDTARPTASIVVAVTALKIGETSVVTISFSEAVTGLTTADFSAANASLGGLSTADGGITWTVTLTPAASITDSTNLVTLDNAGLADLAGNAGAGSTDSNNYAVDTVRPTANIVVADTALKIGETSAVTISFSEAVTGLSLADLSVANGSLGGLSTADGGTVWTATLTPTASVTDASNVVALDNTGVVNLAGNAGAGSTDSNNYGVDTVRPTASIVVATTALTIGETSAVTVTFSEAVTGLTAADLAVANGSLSGLGTADGGITWTATLTPAASITDSTNLVTLDNTGVADLAGNAGSGATDSNNYGVDTARPMASIVVADTALKVGETSIISISFSEPVTGLTTADFSVANGALNGLATVDGGITWTATLTPAAFITDSTNLVTLDNTGVADLAGNAGSGTTDSNNYAVDTARPTASIAVADTALKIGETSAVAISFSEAVTGLSTADFSVANGTLSGLATGDGGVTWTATLTPSGAVSDTTNLVTLDNTGVADLAGNAGTGTTDSNSYAVDTARPTAGIVVADTALKVGETTAVTISFSEAVTGLSTADFNVTNGSLGSLATVDGGITWTAAYTPDADVVDSTNTLGLNLAGVADLAGNAGSGVSESANFSVDTHIPMVTSVAVPADGLFGVDRTLDFTVNFDGAVTVDIGSGAPSLAVVLDTGGTIQAGYLSGSGSNALVFRAAITAGSADADGVALGALSPNGGHIRSAAGNDASTALHAVASTGGIRVDGVAPAVTSVAVPADATYTEGQNLDFTVRWNEAVQVDTTGGAPHLNIALDSGGTVAAAYLGGSGSAALQFRMEVTAGQSDMTGIRVAALVADGAVLRDAAGNAVSLGLAGVAPTGGVRIQTDRDGLSRAEEDQAPGLPPAGGGAPVAGDGNGDGIADSAQPAVASATFVQSDTGHSHPGSAPSTFLTLVSGSTEGKPRGDGTDALITSFTQQDAPADLPAGLEMPVGLVSFTAALASGVHTEHFSLYVDPDLQINGFWKQDASGVWANLASAPYGGGTVMEAGRLRLDFKIDDGGAFDHDGAVNGWISDPGAPGFMPVSIVGQAPDLPAHGFFF